MEAVDVCNKLDCFREGGITKEWPLQPTLTRLWPAFSTSLSREFCQPSFAKRAAWGGCEGKSVKMVQK